MITTPINTDSTRDLILEVLSDQGMLTFCEIAEKVKARKDVTDKTIKKQLSNLSRIGRLVVRENEIGDCSYMLLKNRLSENAAKESELIEPRRGAETEALRSVVEKIAPLLIDAGEKVSLFDLLGRVYDLGKLIEVSGQTDGYMKSARLLLDFFQRYPDIFETETNMPSSNPLRTLISVKDPLGLLLVRYVHDDKEINQLQYFRGKPDRFTETTIDNVKRHNEIVEEIDDALKNNPDLRYITRILALKRASPRWIFGYDFAKGIDEINSHLSRVGLIFEIEDQDRLRMTSRDKTTRKDNGEGSTRHKLEHPS